MSSSGKKDDKYGASMRFAIIWFRQPAASGNFCRVFINIRTPIAPKSDYSGENVLMSYYAIARINYSAHGFRILVIVATVGGPPVRVRDAIGDSCASCRCDRGRIHESRESGHAAEYHIPGCSRKW